NLKGDSEMKRKYIPVKIRRKIIEQYNRVCPACGRGNLSFDADSIEQTATIDHIIPLSRGGTNDESNLQLLCRPCNAAKRDMTMDEYMDYLRKRDETDRLLEVIYNEIPDLKDAFPEILNHAGVLLKYDVVKAIYDY